MAATHFGNCQICGREHKVTGTRVAKHGYTIRHGWQSGACYGSGGKPIQISCDLVEGGIASAKGYIEHANNEIAAPVSEDGTQWLVQNKTTRYGSEIDISKVVLRQVDADVHAVSSYRESDVERKFRNTTVEKVREQVIANRVSYLEATIEQSLESIAFMEKVVANWKPSELRPVTDADKAAAAPKLHFAAKKWGMSTSACTHSASGAQRYKQTTTDRSKVTCTACLKELKEMDERAAKKAAAQ